MKLSWVALLKGVLELPGLVISTISMTYFIYMYCCLGTGGWTQKLLQFPFNLRIQKYSFLMLLPLTTLCMFNVCQPVHPKGDQSWVFIGGTDVEVEAPIIWPPDAKSRLIGKDPDAGKD